MALSDFPKKLEEFFPSYNTDNKIYYERRSKQYDTVSGIEKVRVISMQNLIRSYAAIFLELPHSTTRNFKSILNLLGTEVFNNNHKLEMYYLSAFAFYRIEYLYRSQAIESVLKPARYHILMAFRLICDKSTLPRKNSHDMARYCEPLIAILNDEENYKGYFNKAVSLIIKAADGDFHRDNIRTEGFTAKVRELCEKDS